MTGYYAQKLAAQRLERCYEVAPPRVRQYLEAEIEHLQDRLRPTDTVLELGCGYGRIAFRLAERARRVVGIDVALASVALAAERAGPASACRFLPMDAVALGFRDGSFDAVVCAQNGICAFRVDQRALLAEALRVTRPGGRVLVSTYADSFWPHRLAWFEAQAAEGLVGPIDRERTRDGVIACTDGFRSSRLSANELRALAADLAVTAEITEVDGSSTFAEIAPPPV
ncbi:MAG: class I SAM-dependent methyltransferase [Thermoanaerobaculaceae bacterium]